MEDAARALTRAALDTPVRDLATTRQGTVNYALASRVPRRLMDRLVRWRFRGLAAKGHFDASPMARDFVSRMRS